MAALGSSRNPRLRRVFFVPKRIFHYWLWAYLCSYSEIYGVWNWLSEPRASCAAPARGNSTGLKVLVFGPGKFGTKTVVGALDQLGYKAYHSEDFSLLVLAPFADRYWRSQGQWGGIQNVLAPASMGTAFRDSDSDLRLMEATGWDSLADEVSRCRVDALAVDGLEEAFFGLQAHSPDAKIIALRWRSYEQWKKSYSDFSAVFFQLVAWYGMVLNSVHALPWPVLLTPLFDRISGGDITKALETGGSGPGGSRGSFMLHETWAQQFWRCSVTHRRVIAHWRSGLNLLATFTKDESKFDAYFSEMDRLEARLPPGQVFSLDPRKHGFADICRFIGIKDHPRCSEKAPLPKKIANILPHESQHPMRTFALVLMYLTLHYINYKLVCFCILRPVQSFARRLCPVRAEKTE